MLCVANATLGRKDDISSYASLNTGVFGIYI